VTADGDVKIANACSNPELFWALKGGGTGFGVVTRVTLRTHDRLDVIGAFHLNPVAEIRSGPRRTRRARAGNRRALIQREPVDADSSGPANPGPRRAPSHRAPSIDQYP
jgi:hypothetical protein